MTVIGCDFGNFSSKIVSDRAEASFLSVVGYDTDLMFDEFQTGIMMGNGVSVGELALNNASQVMRHKDDEWISSPEIKILAEAGFSEVVTPDVAKVAAVCAIPINLYKFRRGVLSAALTGKHHFLRIRGKTNERYEMDVLIHELPQGLTVVFDQVLSASGNPESAIALEKVGCVDIGGRDLNILSANTLTPVEHESETIHGGCWNLIEAMRKDLSSSFDRPSLSEYEGESALRTGLFWNSGEWVDVSDMASRHKARFVESILTHVKRLWADPESFKRIFISGGGAELVGEALLDRMPNGHLVGKPVYSNARGAKKFGGRYQ